MWVMVLFPGRTRPTHRRFSDRSRFRRQSRWRRMESHRSRAGPHVSAAFRLLRQRLCRLAAQSPGRGKNESMKVELTKYKTSDEVDFVIVGSGAAGGIIAKELSTNGFRVVVLEQGPYLTEADFVHDEVKVIGEDLLTNKPNLQPTSFRKTPNEKAKPQRALVYDRCVGGTSVHFTANFWRFHEIDFIERSKIWPVPRADLRDWPLTYADL